MTLRQLPNQIVAVVISTGFLYLMSGESEKIIAKYDLLTNLDLREERGVYDRIVKAKLDFKKRPYVYGQPEPSLTFDLVMAFATHS